jgi:tetratricopeptide (TPR) repeat protein
VLPALSGGPRDLPERQRTLRDAIAWSHDLLSAEDQTLFRRLGVFVGGFTIEAAETVTGGETDRRTGGQTDSDALFARITVLPNVLDGIASLVDNSLLRERVAAGEPRFEMFEAIREFALERLAESGESDAVSAAHATYFAALAERGAPELHGADQRQWCDRFEDERPNLRAALAWFDANHAADRMLAMTADLGMFWMQRGPLPEARSWFERALASDPGAGTASELAWAAVLAWQQGDFAQVREWARRGLALAEASGDSAAEGETLHAMCLNAVTEGDLERAVQYGERAVAKLREVRTVWLQYVLADFGWVLALKGEIERGSALAEEGRTLSRQRGNRFGIGVSTSDWGLIAEQSGDIDGAADLYRESVSQFAALGEPWYVTSPLAGLGSIAVHRGRFLLAARLLAAAARLREVSGSTAQNSAEHGRDAAAVEATRAALGEAGFAAAWAAGRALPLDAVIEEALTEGGEPGTE